MVVTATYSDKSKKAVTGFTLSGNTNLSAGEKTITVNYTEGKVSKSATLKVTVEPVPVVMTDLVIVTKPAKVRYNVGDIFDSTGIALKAIYSDGSEKSIPSFSITDGGVLKATQTFVTVSYSEAGETKTAKIDIIVDEVPITVVGVAISGEWKSAYKPGESFDATGMTVKVRYSDGTENSTSEITVLGGVNLTRDIKFVTVNTKIDNVEVSLPVAITVSETETSEKHLAGIRIAALPEKVAYATGENFVKDGMVVIATYSDGTEAQVIAFTVEGGENLAVGTTSVKVSYTEGNMTKTADVPIRVSVDGQSSAEGNDFPWWILIVSVCVLGVAAIVVFGTKKKN